MSRAKINTADLVKKIERLTRERMAKSSLVNMSDIRRMKVKKVQRVILVIEDDETIRMVLKRLLEGEGYRVLDAADGTELGLVLEDTPVDLIILDVGLPWINGFELAEMMKANPDLAEIPLVFLSGQTSDADVKKGFAVGADDYIKKPFSNESIKKTVNTLINLSKD